MVVVRPLLVGFLLGLSIVTSCSTSQHKKRRATAAYQPNKDQCPPILVQPAAHGVHAEEKAWVEARKAKADVALCKWLGSIDKAFTTDGCQMPTLALASSGGGFRAFLINAGVHQAFDASEKMVQSKLKGLYQAMQYESGLSGGSWLLGSIVDHSWPTISELKKTLWYRTITESPLQPNQDGTIFAEKEVLANLQREEQAGYRPTLVNLYGRLLGYTLLRGDQGGQDRTLSSLTSDPHFAHHDVPLPIFTALEATSESQCVVEPDAVQFEFTPFTLGSWDKERAWFVPTRLAGSIVDRYGRTSCVTGFDELNFIIGLSSDTFTLLCRKMKLPGSEASQGVANLWKALLSKVHKPASRDLYAAFPDPFTWQDADRQALVPLGARPPSELYMVDGGFSGQTSPIWPFLHRSNVDVLFVVDSDVSTTTGTNLPDGLAIYLTYLQAKARGLRRMPIVPDNATMVAKGYNRRPTFFGCDEGKDVMTIVYLPNAPLTFPSNTCTFKMSYTEPEIDGMLANGIAVATHNGTEGFEKCIACVIMRKTDTSLPSSCQKCLRDYCAKTGGKPNMM